MVAEKDVGSRELEKDKTTVTLSVWVSNQSFQKKKVMVSIRPFHFPQTKWFPVRFHLHLGSNPARPFWETALMDPFYQIWMDVQMAYLSSGKLT